MYVADAGGVKESVGGAPPNPFCPVRTLLASCPMTKKLTRGTTPLELSTDGDVIVLTPVRSAKRTERLRKVMRRAHDQYAGTFKRLSE